MDRHMLDTLAHLSPGENVVIAKADHSIINAMILDIDYERDEMVVSSQEDEEPTILSFREIDHMENVPGEFEPETLDQQLKRIAPGKYLMAWGKFGRSINETCEQGKLVSINWDNRTLILHNTVYDTDYTVNIDKISWIDESRERSGALGSAIAPDWYRGADGKWRKNGREAD